MGFKLFSKPNHSVDKPATIPHRLKKLAAVPFAEQTRALLLQKYKDLNQPVEIMYVKKDWKGNEFVSNKPPRFYKDKAQARYQRLLTDLGIHNADATGPEQRMGRLSAMSSGQMCRARPGDEFENDVESESSSSETSRSEDPPIPTHKPSQAELRVVRAQELNEVTHRIAYMFQDAPPKAELDGAIADARDPENRSQLAFEEHIAFPEALLVFLPKPPGAPKRMSPLAKLDHYLRNTDLPARVSEDELSELKTYYLDLCAHKDRMDAAAATTQAGASL